MPLQPEVEQLLAAIAALDAPATNTLTPAEVRALYAAMAVGSASVAPEVPATDDTLGDIGVRVYEPPGSSPDGPTLVWYHGGGWVIGDVTVADPTCRYLADRAGVRIVSVDYRLAPEHPFPTPVEDAYAAFVAVAEGKLGGPPSRIAVGGDSAGGNLAAVVSQVARDRGGVQPDLQLLFYPVTDGSMDTASYAENGEGFFLTAETMTWFFDHYTTARLDPYVSPLRAESLAGLPRAVVITAEYDPLRDEGEAYAAALAAAGVPVTMRRFDGQIHGFTSMPEMCGPTAFDAIDLAASELRKLA